MIKKLLLVLALLLLPGVAEAVDYYVAVGGSGSTCSLVAPCGTIQAGVSKLASGDRLYLRGGTYNDFIDNSGYTIPSGTASNYTKIWAYPGETVTLRPTTDRGYVIALYRADQLSGRTDEYIHFDRLIIDAFAQQGGTGPQAISVGQSHLRFSDMEVFGAGNTDYPGNGVSAGGDFNEFYGTTPGACNIHDNGKTNHDPYNSGGYGMYIGGNDWQVYNCKVHHNGGYGLHVYAQGHTVNRISVSRNEFYANHQSGFLTTAALLLSSGDGNVAYNNIIHDEPAGGIQIYNGCTNCLVYNNTLYNIGWFGISGEAGSSGSVWRNNIIVNSNVAGRGDANVQDTSVGTTRSNNLCFGTGGTTNCNLTSDPLFVNASISDFRLQAGSPALDVGFPLAFPYDTDINQTTRPQGSAYDLGAYERAATPTCPSLPNALIAQYRFEGVSTDSSGNGLTATLGTGWTYTTGKYGQGVTTTGISGITVNDNDILDLCASFTLELWVNVPSSSTDVMFIAKNPSSKYFLGMLANFCDPTTSLLGGYSQGAAVGACSAPDLTAGLFYHLAVSYDGTTVSLYRNASLVTTAAGGAVLDATTGTLQFCTSGFGETCPAGTIIDEVKIYRGPRTGAQIMADMLDGSTPAQVVLKIPAGATGLKLGGAGVKLGTQSQ